ncbi:MAG: sarcosine oxidase subunit delta [Gammaproteobacteria bacterium]
MRIECPFCGERDLTEFVYLGDADVTRPDPLRADAMERFVEAVHTRENPAGVHNELWYHNFGCRSWLRVTRNTRTHELLSVEFATARFRRRHGTA